MQFNLIPPTREPSVNAQPDTRPLFADRSNRTLSGDNVCRCASCRAYKECANLIFVAICAVCWQQEQDRVAKNRRERRWGTR